MPRECAFFQTFMMSELRDMALPMGKVCTGWV